MNTSRLIELLQNLEIRHGVMDVTIDSTEDEILDIDTISVPTSDTTGARIVVLHPNRR